MVAPLGGDELFVAYGGGDIAVPHHAGDGPSNSDDHNDDQFSTIACSQLSGGDVRSGGCMC